VLEESGQQDSGSLLKFNTSYKFTPDLMGYVTISEGYRIGGNNGIAPCPDPLPPTQVACALPDEVQYSPDKTVNYEVGVHSQWLGGALTLNGAVFFIDWQDPQLQSATANASLPFTKNGQGAESRGVELSFDSRFTDALSLRGSYSYVKAELSDVAPALIRVYTPPGFGPTDPPEYVDGRKGDRLPGSPQRQATLFTEYSMPVAADWLLRLQYGVSYTGDIITRTGLRANGETLGGFTLHSAAATLSGGPWTVALYAQNLFNKYAITGTRSSRWFLQSVEDENGDIVRVRSYGRDVLRPREVGLRFTYDFEL
jgi:outer membrane receptor protein involved in Fe transport